MVTRKAEKNKSLKQQGLDILFSYFANGKGSSKHQDLMQGRRNKREASADAVGGDPSNVEYYSPTAKKIYCHKTLETYIQHWSAYCNFLKNSGLLVNGHKPRTLDEAKEFVQDYIDFLIDQPGKSEGSKMSAWTINTKYQSLAKVLGLKSRNYFRPKRYSSDISRSRGGKKSDAHFSEKNNDELVSFCRCTGLRNDKELKVIKNDCLVDASGNPWLPGMSLDPYIRVNGKGGKNRFVPIEGTDEETAKVIDRIISTPDGEFVWSKVHSAADVHGYRRDYANKIYLKYARPADELNPKNKFEINIYDNSGNLIRSYWRSEVYARHNGSKEKLDARALYEVSKALGHNRVDVSAVNYVSFDVIADIVKLISPDDCIQAYKKS